MNKFGAVLATVGVTIGAYLFLLVVMPVVGGMAATSNTTMHASSNMTNYPGTEGFLMSTPLILFFVPGVICIAVVIMILRRP